MKESMLLSVAGKTLAFGLEWLPLVESLGISEARRRANRYRATHLVLASDTAGAVGLANIHPRQLGGAGKNQLIFAAAQNVASLFPTGTWVVCLNLAADSWWLVAVHEGVVVRRTDMLAPNPESFETMITELRRAYPGLICLQSGQDNKAPALTDVARACAPGNGLQARQRRWAGMPAKVWVWVALLTAGLLLVLSVRQTSPTALAERAPVTAHDATHRWHEARQAALNNVRVHGVTGTQRLLEALYGVSLSPGGWQLRQVDCVPRPEGWQCLAQFHRSHPATDNALLAAALPASWQIEVGDLDRAQASWSVPYSGLTLAQVSLPTEAESGKTRLGILQRSSIAFERIVWGTAVPLPVAPPIDEEGQPLPRPDQWQTVQSRSVRLSGPLRSYALLLADFNAIRWSRAQLSINEKVTPGVRASRLNLLLEGEFYERVE